VRTQWFVNETIDPKWFGLMLLSGLVGVAWSMTHHKTYLPASRIYIILVSCLSLVFIREWATSGALLLYPAGLLLLFLLLWKPITLTSVTYWYGTIIVFAFILALHGLCQYAGLLPSANNRFIVTGSFDNPAGIASALACAWPLCFLFFASTNHYLRFCFYALAVIIAIAIILSGSRAGMLAIVVAMAIWLWVKIASWKIKTAIIVAIVTLPVVMYYFKKDSADGRLLIWRVSLDMVADKPVTGHGLGAFQAKYMLYQAEYISTHPDSPLINLADNTYHPFNEYLRVLCEHGIVGLGAIVVLGILLVRTYRNNRSNEQLPAIMSLSALAVFSLFSYPFTYPFTWVVLFLDMAVIGNLAGVQAPVQKWNLLDGNIPRIAVLLFSIVVTAYAIVLARAEIKWNRIARLSLAGKTLVVFPEYDRLSRHLGKNGFFLYNHAAELYEAGEFEKSIVVAERCTKYFNDMDVQMLMADNYCALEQYAEAEQHLKTATAMCPARFRPLYELAQL
jgi:O-antigen ligase